MADKNGSQNFSENPDPQEKPVSGDDITHPQEQQVCTRQASSESGRMVGAHHTAVIWRSTRRRKSIPANDLTSCS